MPQDDLAGHIHAGYGAMWDDWTLTAQVRRRVSERLTQRCIGHQQVLLLSAQPRADYLAAYGKIDIVLDPFPYPGGTTSLESLWMGVPVLTCHGTSALSRQGLSILRNLGLCDWVAADPEEYLGLAIRHASNLPALSTLRQGLRQRLLQSPLCDAPLFADHLQACLRELWQRWCEHGARVAPPQ